MYWPLSQNAYARSRPASRTYSVTQAPAVSITVARFFTSARKNSVPVSDAVPATTSFNAACSETACLDFMLSPYHEIGIVGEQSVDAQIVKRMFDLRANAR